MHVNKDSDKIVIVQSTHNAAMGPMTRSKAKSTSLPSTKQTSESTCLLKPIRTRDEHQSCITLASPRAKSHSPHSKGKLPLALKDFGDKSPCSITDTNSNTGSHSNSSTGTSKKENYFNCSDFFYFLMTMSVMATNTTFVKELLVEMACAMVKLTKMIEEKDMQIASLINKVEAQVQNTGESSHGLNHLLNVASPLDDAPHASRTVQVGGQTMESTLVASLSVQHFKT